VKLFYGLTSYSPLGSGDAYERVIKAIFKAAGWDLADERFLQLKGLVGAFPLSLADGLADDMLRLKRMCTMLSTTAAISRRCRVSKIERNPFAPWQQHLLDELENQRMHN
jgi:hypothetical protein